MKIVIFMLVLSIAYSGLDYLISDDTSDRTRVTFHDFFDEEKVDTLILGTSHSIYTIDATRLTEDMGESVFNMSTSRQDFIGAYYILKNAVSKFDIKKVYCEVSFSVFAREEADETATYIIADYLDSKINRTQYLLNSMDIGGYTNAFLRARRNIDPLHLPTLTQLEELRKEKETEKYKDYIPGSLYRGRGQWEYNEDWVDDEGHVAANIYGKYVDDCTVEEVNQQEVQYFKKIIELCKENNIELILFVAPYTPVYLITFPGYADFSDMIRDIADEYEVSFFDFNLIKEEFFKKSYSDFKNPDHINTTSSDGIINFLELYDSEPNGDYFYNDILEVLQKYKGEVVLGYHVFYVTEDGMEYESENEAVAHSEITSVRIEICGVSYPENITCNAVMSSVKQNSKSGKWNTLDTIPGITVDEKFTSFNIPYKDFRVQTYNIELLDPDTGTKLYGAKTKFDMI